MNITQVENAGKLLAMFDGDRRVQWVDGDVEREGILRRLQFHGDPNFLTYTVQITSGVTEIDLPVHKVLSLIEAGAFVEGWK